MTSGEIQCWSNLCEVILDGMIHGGPWWIYTWMKAGTTECLLGSWVVFFGAKALEKEARSFLIPALSTLLYLYIFSCDIAAL